MNSHKLAPQVIRAYPNADTDKMVTRYRSTQEIAETVPQHNDQLSPEPVSESEESQYDTASLSSERHESLIEQPRVQEAEPVADLDNKGITERQQGFVMTRSSDNGNTSMVTWGKEWFPAAIT